MDSFVQISNPRHMDFLDLVLTFETELYLFYVCCREHTNPSWCLNTKFSHQIWYIVCGTSNRWRHRENPLSRKQRNSFVVLYFFSNYDFDFQKYTQVTNIYCKEKILITFCCLVHKLGLIVYKLHVHY